MFTLHTTLPDEDADIFFDICKENRVSISAVLRCLVTDFLDTTDRKHADYIIAEAQKIKQGRPREY